MMKKKQSHWWRMMWIAVTIPLIGISLMAFSKPKETLRVAVDNSVRFIEQPVPDLKPGDVIKGCVRDQDGQPLEFTNIVEVDEYQRIVAHTISDNNGNFTLKVVDPKHKIRISYVGFMSKTLDISSNKIDVMLEPSMKIGEVKVVGKTDSMANQDTPENKKQAVPNDSKVFDMVEQAPVFPGGQMEILNYLNHHLSYPSVAREMHVEADIVVRFTVDKTGLVRSPQIVNVTSKTPLISDETMKAAKEGKEDAVEATKNYYDAVEAMKEEAIHVVRTMPRWEPGRQNGKRVDTTWTLPISFNLN